MRLVSTTLIAVMNEIRIATFATMVFVSTVHAATASGQTWACQSKVLANGMPYTVYITLDEGSRGTSSKIEFPSYAEPLHIAIQGDKVTGTDHLGRTALDANFAGKNLKVVSLRGVPTSCTATPASGPVLPAYIAPPPLLVVADNHLAHTPPMGWNSWNKLAATVDDAAVRRMADAMVRSGMRNAGYTYINIDDTWQGVRDADGNLRPNSKFPDMAELARYVHARGLKLGIYSSPGPLTCAGYPGSYGHEDQDARTFASWGIDYLKYDWCSARWIYDPSQMRAVYQRMSQALQATGRPIMYSLCQYGYDDVWKWGRAAGGNLWRIGPDIHDSWQWVSEIAKLMVPIASMSGPGGWNDPDALEIGNGNMSLDEYRTHLSLWSIMAAPLLASNDLSTMDAETREILTNLDVLAIDQDPLGEPGTQVSIRGESQIWVRHLEGGDDAVALINTGERTVTTNLKLATLGIKDKGHYRNLWTHSAGSVADLSSNTLAIPAHGVAMFRLMN